MKSSSKSSSKSTAQSGLSPAAHWQAWGVLSCVCCVNPSAVTVGRHGEVCKDKTTDKVVNQEDRWYSQDAPSQTTTNSGRCGHALCSGLCAHEMPVHKVQARCHCIVMTAGTGWRPLLHSACLLPRRDMEVLGKRCPWLLRSYHSYYLHFKGTRTKGKLEEQERGLCFISFIRVKGPKYFNFRHQACDDYSQGT